MKSCPQCQNSYPTEFVVCPQDGTAHDSQEFGPHHAMKPRFFGVTPDGRQNLSDHRQKLLLDHGSVKRLAGFPVLVNRTPSDVSLGGNIFHRDPLVTETGDEFGSRIEDLSGTLLLINQLIDFMRIHRNCPLLYDK